MRTATRILSVGLLALYLAAVAGCGKKATEGHAPEQLIIEPLVGIGSVKFGMSQDQVIEHFGQPDRVLEGTVTKLNYVASKGLVFAIDSELGLQEIGCWSEGMLPSRVTTFAGKTKEGIGIGAAHGQIIEAYGQPDRTSTDSSGAIQNLHYNKLGARFSLKADRLMSMVLEAPK
jgi:hypothetical protein